MPPNRTIESPEPAVAGTSEPRCEGQCAGWARRHRRALRRTIVAAVALWFFWYPMDRAELFYALPERTAAAAYVRNLAMEDRALLRNP